MVEKVLDNFWDAKFVSIFPVYFADGVKEASSLLLDTLWEKAIPARIKIRQIELGNELEFTRSISSNEVRDILMDLIECSVKSILIFLPDMKLSNGLTNNVSSKVYTLQSSAGSK